MTTVKRIGCLIVLAMGVLPGRAATYHVSTNGVDGANDGLSWATAFRSISNAVAKAADGDAVIVSNGTYAVTTNLVITAAITLTGVNGPEVTAIDGANNTRCLVVSNSGAVVEGFTVRRGKADKAYHASRLLGGGGILFAGIVRDCVFRDNTGQDGGGLYFHSGTLISNCVFASNVINGYGGGLANFFHSGGTIVGCTVSNNTGHGGGIFINHGTVENCRIIGNTGLSMAGGVHHTGGTNRNCLIAGNRHPSGVGGINLATGALLENATVADNLTFHVTEPGGIKAASGTTVRNTISYNNWGIVENSFAAGTVTYTLMNPAVSGAGNIAGDPLFLDAKTGDYRLSLASPALHAGTNLAWMAAATDLAGAPRISPATAGTNDMGCYEMPVDALACTPEAAARSGFAPFEAVFIAHTAGTNLTALYYRWSFTNSAVVDAEGFDKGVVTNTYAAGVHTIALTVSNAAGEVAAMTRPNYIKAGPAEVFVALSGSNTADFPYDSWGAAASNIQAAVDAAVNGSTVWVSNGVYTVTERIRVLDGVTVRSVNGRDLTGINGNKSTGGVHLNHTNAVLRGFAVTNSIYPSPSADPNRGAGVQIYAGLVDDCLIGWNKGHSGGGVNISHLGVLRHSLVVSNETYGSYGSAVTTLPFARAGLIESCAFLRNINGHTGALQLDGGVLRNSLIARNSNVHGAGGVSGPRTLIESCTIVLNHNPTVGATLAGGLIGNAETRITNTIVAGNTSVSVNPDYYLPAGAVVSHSRLMPAYAGAVNSTTNDPLLVNAPGGDYTLSSASPCVNTGTNAAWMTTTLTTDLAGGARIQGGIVDMGAYEFDLDTLTCSFTPGTVEGFEPLSVSFVSTVSGLNTNNLYYRWSFEDGTATDLEGYGLAAVTNTYAAGLYWSALTVSNALGETASFAWPTAIKAGPVDAYVTVAGGSPPAFPYASWAAAASNLQHALDAAVAGTRVWVSNGVYALPATASNAAGAVVRSVNGPGLTTLRGNGTFYIYRSTHTAGVLDGFTLTGGGGDAQPGGGGAYLLKGALLNCLVISNAAYRGGGVYLDSADTLVSNCVVRSNSTSMSYGAGVAAVMYPGGLVTDCVVVDNSGPWTAGVYMRPGGTLRNTLVAFNRCTGGLAGTPGGVDIGGVGSLVESCTIVSNSMTVANAPGGLYASPDVDIYNTIVRDNSAPDIPNYLGGRAMYHCNVSPAWTGTGSGNIDADSRFVDGDAMDYRLLAESPCVNTGTNRAWMTGARDLGGQPRVVKGTVDIGAYERQPDAGTVIWLR